MQKSLSGLLNMMNKKYVLILNEKAENF